MENSALWRHLVEPQIISFYGWWELIVCLFAFLGLMAIWWHIGRRQQDAGQVWLALSILCWSFSGVVEIMYAQEYAGYSNSIFQKLENTLLEDKEPLTATDLESILSESDQYIAAHSIKLDGWRSILSLFNSLFILLALPYFRYKPKRLAPVINSNYWNYIIGLPFLFEMSKKRERKIRLRIPPENISFEGPGA